MTNSNAFQAINRLIEIMATLRSPGGCPWDAEQTPETLKPFILEETYEVLEAIDAGDPQFIRDELGDLLLQVVFQAQIFKERQAFDISDVANAISDKLVRRHPHVFGNLKITDQQTLTEQWDKIKSEEKSERGQKHTILEGVPKELPALLRAQKISEKASRAGFDWPEIDGVFSKIHEELEELELALKNGTRKEQESEIGDLLFTIVNLARFLDMDAEESLRKTTNRFLKRFEHIEKKLKQQHKGFKQTTLDELNAIWEEAKSLEGKN